MLSCPLACLAVIVDPSGRGIHFEPAVWASRVFNHEVSGDAIHRACSETLVLVHLVLEEQIGPPKERRISYSGGNRRRTST